MEEGNEGSKVEGDDFGAFIEKFSLFPPSQLSPSTRPLHGLTFAVKDIFDITGHVTGFGNLDWARTHVEANSTSSAVLSIIEAGATCVGKTVMDELAFSINGENKHYGTPINPLAPDRVPGGSSSGSAVAVAAKLVDFSLGTDTGGSVRVPAAYCGIFGFRPSHAAVSTSGVIPMAPTFDTVGWFARDPIILDQVGRVLLKVPLSNTLPPSRIIIPDDCYKILRSHGIQISQVLITSVEKIFGGDIVQHINLGNYFSTKIPSLRTFMDESYELMEDTVPSLLALSNAMRILQRIEFKYCHYEWVNTVKPEIGPEISERVQQALNMTDEHLDHCHLVRSEIQASLGALLEDNGVLAVPVVSGPPPKLCTEVVALETFRAKSFGFLSIAGMSGFFQVVIPLGVRDNLPVSVSLMDKHGADHFLLCLVQTLYGTLREQASILSLID